MQLCHRPNTNESNEAQKNYDPVVASLHRIIEQPVPSRSLDGSIYKVPEPLRSTKPEAFTPTCISIGPYHSRRNDLMVNSLKPILLQHFLHLTNHTPTTIVQKVGTWEERARGCYAEPIDMSSNEFVQLLVLDGCFVVTRFFNFYNSEFEIPNTSDLWKFWNEIYYDLLLLENQLPYFLLQFLYDLFPSSQHSLPSPQVSSFIQISEIFIPLDQKGLFSREVRLLGDIGAVVHFVDFLKKHFTPTASFEHWNQPACWPPTASELHECGVIFRAGKNILFDDKGGYLELPQIKISDSFEKLMKNLIAYEQCQCQRTMDINNEVSNFALFMKCLVQTNQDVKLLIDEGVIENNFCSIKEITQLFINLSDHVVPGYNSYNSECSKMREYCKCRRHRWMTSLKRNYFSTPWLCASSIAAILLLALTLIQTVVTVLAAFK